MQEFRFTLEALKKFWLFGLSAATIVILASYLTAINADRVYQTHATLVMTPNVTGGEGRQVVDGLRAIESRALIATISRLISSETLQKEVADSLSGKIKPKGYSQLRGGVIPDTYLLRVIATGKDPESLTQMSNAMATHIRRYVRDNYFLVRLQIVDTAQVPVNAIAPQIGRTVGAGVTIGLILGIALMMLLQAFSVYRKFKRATFPV